MRGRLDPRCKPILLFLLLLCLFPATHSLVTWYRGEPMGFGDWLGVAAFPLLAWLWLRYFSVLGCREGCDLSDRQRK